MSESLQDHPLKRKGIMELTEDEAQIIELIRKNASPNVYDFRVVIERIGGAWETCVVAVIGGKPLTIRGKGTDFHKAWQSMNLVNRDYLRRSG